MLLYWIVIIIGVTQRVSRVWHSYGCWCFSSMNTQLNKIHVDYRIGCRYYTLYTSYWPIAIVPRPPVERDAPGHEYGVRSSDTRRHHQRPRRHRNLCHVVGVQRVPLLVPELVPSVSVNSTTRPVSSAFPRHNVDFLNLNWYW